MVKRKYKLRSKPVTKSISIKLNNLIKKKQRELQLKENIEFGRKGAIITFQYASDIIAKQMEGKR